MYYPSILLLGTNCLNKTCSLVYPTIAMDFNESTPRKYPQRKRVKVKYYEDFETSLDLTPKPKRTFKTNSSSDENEKENDTINSMLIDVSLEDEALSDYEKLRLKNLEENRRMMLELGLIEPDQLEPTFPKVEKKRLPKYNKVKAKAPKPSAPLKRSLRLLKKTPEGKDLPIIPFDSSFEETPDNTAVLEEPSRFEEEVLPMNEDCESMAILERLKKSISYEPSTTGDKSVENLINDVKGLKFAKLIKITSSRIHGLTVHPIQSKLVVYGGSTHGEVVICNVTDGEINHFYPHKSSVPCLTVDQYDSAKLLTTSHDGTVRQADINKAVFNMVYQTDEDQNMCHLTWHSQVDANTLLVAHGTGQVGLVDTRVKQGQAWFQCHPRSVRTTHLHPTKLQYFLTSSGTGECKIWDIRMAKNKTQEPLSELFSAAKGRGLTSAFFSPDGTKVVSTSNDDYLTVHDASDLSKPKVQNRVLHNNHTGRWLTVFRTVWHPTSSDLIFVGSMIPQPRRIQMYNSSLQLIKEFMDDNVTSINSVIALHPKNPVIIGGNSTGKIHIFTNSDLATSFKQDDI